jgi:hypothetical protein
MQKFLNKLYIVYLSIKNKLPILLGKIFTKANLNKIIIIFIVGFISRVFIVNIYNVNVYFEYLNIISILYYSCMSFFIVIVHELVNYYEFNIIPSYFLELFSIANIIFKNLINAGKYMKVIINSANKSIFSLKLSDFKISSIRKDFMLYLNKEKMTLDVEISDNKNIEKAKDMLNNKVLQKNNLKSSRGRSINSHNGVNSSNSNGTRNPRPREDNRIFVPDTREAVPLATGQTESSLPIPEPRSTATSPSTYSIQIGLSVPKPSDVNLSTPSISTINTNTPKIETLTNAVYSANNSNPTGTTPRNRVDPILYDTGKSSNGSTPTISTLNSDNARYPDDTTVYYFEDKNSPVTSAQRNGFKSSPAYAPVSSQYSYYPAASSSQSTYYPAASSSQPVYHPTASSSKPVYYPTKNNSTSASGNNNYIPVNGNEYYYKGDQEYPVSGEVPYYNSAARESSSSNQATIGLNAS